jgi:hypothetical protein
MNLNESNKKQEIFFIFVLALVHESQDLQIFFLRKN